jgi:hypothetical protein
MAPSTDGSLAERYSLADPCFRIIAITVIMARLTPTLSGPSLHCRPTGSPRSLPLPRRRAAPGGVQPHVRHRARVHGPWGRSGEGGGQDERARARGRGRAAAARGVRRRTEPGGRQVSEAGGRGGPRGRAEEGEEERAEGEEAAG